MCGAGLDVAEHPAQPRLPKPRDGEFLTKAPRDDVKKKSLEALTLFRRSLGTGVAPARRERISEPETAPDNHAWERSECDRNWRCIGGERCDRDRRVGVFKGLHIR
jgi:hypothetical protein